MSPPLFLAAWFRDGPASRRAIEEAVRAAPGIHAAEVGKKVGLSWSTVAYHVRVLRRQGHLHVDKGGREMRLFPADLPHRHKAWFAVLRDDDTQAVLRRLLNDEGQGVPELSEGLQVSHKVIRRHLVKLTESGLARRSDEPKPLYTVTEDAEKALKEYLRSIGKDGDRRGHAKA